MENTISITIAALKNFANFRYKAELTFLKTLEAQTSLLDNAALGTLFRSGIEMSKIFVDSRYNIEKKVLDGFQSSPVRSDRQNNDSVTIEHVKKPKPIPSGTIKVTTQKHDLVSLPLNIQNQQEKDQEIEVTISNLESAGKELTKTGLIVLRNPKELVQANSSAIFYIDINIKDNSYKPGKKYVAKLLVKGKESRSFDLFIDVVEKKKSGDVQDKPIILFVPPRLNNDD